MGPAAHARDPVRGLQRRHPRPRRVGVVVEGDREADGHLQGREVAPDIRRMAPQGVERVADLLGSPGGIPRIGVGRDGPQRLAPAGPADEDREVLLDGARGADCVVERVDRAPVIEPLAVEQAPHQRHGLLQAIQPLAGPTPEVDAEGVVLTLEPGPADAEDRPSARHMVQGRRQLGREAWVAERVGPHHQAEPDPFGQRPEAGHQGPALQDRLLPRAEDRKEMVPRPDRVPPVCLGVEGRVPECGPGGRLGPELKTEAHSWTPVSRGDRGRRRCRAGS